MHTRSRINHKLTFLWLFCWRSPEYPLFGRRVEGSFVVLFELVYVFGKVPSLASGTSLLSFSLCMGPDLKFQSVGTSLMRIFDLYFSKRWSFLFGYLLDVAQTVWIVLVDLFPKLFRSGFPDTSRFSEVLMALTLARHTTQLWYSFHKSYSTLVVAFSPFFGMVSLFRLLVWLFINLMIREQTLIPALPIQFYRIEIREDANTHKVISNKYLSNSTCTVVEEFCQSDFCLWRFFFSSALPPRVIDGSEGGAAFGVGFGAWSLLSYRKLHWSPFEHCPFFFPLVSFFNATWALSCSCFDFPVCGVRVS